jgi:hypothetical protein
LDQQRFRPTGLALPPVFALVTAPGKLSRHWCYYEEIEPVKVFLRLFAI